jgi:hypothetical protein
LILFYSFIIYQFSKEYKIKWTKFYTTIYF